VYCSIIIRCGSRLFACTNVDNVCIGQLNGAECEQAVGDAIEAGYRHFDSAQAYANEVISDEN
jgi:diketogulonate reductase-like aldo/keto reductase